MVAVAWLMAIAAARAVGAFVVIVWVGAALGGCGSAGDEAVGWAKVQFPESLALPHLIAAWTGRELLLWGSKADLGFAYNPETSRWRQLAASSRPVVYGTASAWTDHELIVHWGDLSPSVSAYDLQTDTWRLLTDAPTTSGYSANILWNGTEVLLVTGDRVVVYCPEADAWELATEPPTPLGRNREAVWTGAELLVWPTETSRSTKRGLAHNPIEDTWRTLPDPPAWPAMPDVVWTGEELIVSTGHLGTGLGTPESLLLSYQPDTEVWKLLGTSPVSGYNTTAMVAGNRLILFSADGLFISEAQWGSLDSDELQDEAAGVGSVVESDPASEIEISGLLPNGDRYLVRARPALNDYVESISAAIVIDLDDGELPIEGPVVGITSFYSTARENLGAFRVRDDYVAVDSGNWLLLLNIYDHVMAVLGESAKSLLLDSIAAHDPPDDSGLPAFELQEPLRWAEEYEVPLQMEGMAHPRSGVCPGAGNLVPPRRVG